MAHHCPECGFVITEGANYCQKCGAFIGARADSRDDVTTATYVIDETTGELRPGRHRRGRRAEAPRSSSGRRRPRGRSRSRSTGERLTIGRTPDAEIFLDDVTVSRDHAVLVHRSGDWFLDDSARSTAPTSTARRIDSHRLEDGDELQVGKYKLTFLARADGRARNRHRGACPTGSDGAAARRRRKSLTIGAVCKALSQEFPDISISKIRYLEDQKLLAPRRTPGGYRLYSTSDVSRLRTILRMQRDEFLPLRVIRQELAAGRATEEDVPAAAARARARRTGDARPSAALRRLTFSIRDRDALLLARGRRRGDPRRAAAGAGARGLRDRQGRAARRVGTARSSTTSTEREIVRAVTELSRYGVAGRNLRVFRTSAEREAALLQQILAPALRSRNPERRKEAVEALENLAAVTSHLKHLLLVRDLRRIAK